MARNYGRIATSIWRDPDFLALTPEARFTYAMLITQPDVTACGTLALTERRWARALGYEHHALEAALKELAASRFVIIDYDTEELLIRTFVKWDGGANNELRRKSILQAADTVASPPIRDAIAHELTRTGLLNRAPDTPTHALSDSPTEAASDTPTDRPSQGPSHPLSDRRRVVDTKEGTSPTHNPQPTTREGTPIATSPQAAPPNGAPPPETCRKHPDGTDDPCGPCATARRRAQRWHTAAADRLVAERTLAAQRATTERARRDACPACDPDGWALNPTYGTPTARKCTHPGVTT